MAKVLRFIVRLEQLQRLIDQAFLPSNPNKMRNAHPDVIAAVRQFKALVAAVGRPGSALPAGRDSDAN